MVGFFPSFKDEWLVVRQSKHVFVAAAFLKSHNQLPVRIIGTWAPLMKDKWVNAGKSPGEKVP